MVQPNICWLPALYVYRGPWLAKRLAIYWSIRNTAPTFHVTISMTINNSEIDTVFQWRNYLFSEELSLHRQKASYEKETRNKENMLAIAVKWCKISCWIQPILHSIGHLVSNYKAKCRHNLATVYILVNRLMKFEDIAVGLPVLFVSGTLLRDVPLF